MSQLVARTGHATLFSGGEPTRVKRDPSGRVEPAQKLIDDYAVPKSAAYQCSSIDLCIFRKRGNR